MDLCNIDISLNTFLSNIMQIYIADNVITVLKPTTFIWIISKYTFVTDLIV